LTAGSLGKLAIEWSLQTGDDNGDDNGDDDLVASVPPSSGVLYRNTTRPTAFGIGVAVGRRLGSDHANGA
jgi:hypothetical protein